MPSNLRVDIGGVIFTPPYFDELIAGVGDIKARLPRDPGAHALWYYYNLAFKQMKEAQANIVYEDELSKKFSVGVARKLLERIAFMYGLDVATVVRYWEAVDAQRIALGYTQNAELPAALKFRFN